ncbi:thermonuclease family protein [Methylobrevis pamukkalensis]|uniref:TNase-like domain-containing protein n=1 Tax=Methylobrevis pamukkalensis TaxID=1439726 RepID=A0A1E3H289_9HYPH|nr:hypothetical protein [Methylobrevis pamukkalensis]ODN69651.1 hypothetical protein A6302_03029 [Methylobrevis pamukkalensis]
MPPLGRDVTPDGVTRAPRLEGPLERIAAPVTTVATPQQRVRYRRAIVIDAGRVRVVVDDRPLMVSFAGIEAPAFDAVCTDRGGQEWKCGAQARADLARLIQSRSLQCAPAEPAEGTVRTDCTVGRHDIAAWLAARGWARAGEGASDAVRTAEAEARKAALGLWR